MAERPHIIYTDTSVIAHDVVKNCNGKASSPYTTTSNSTPGGHNHSIVINKSKDNNWKNSNGNSTSTNGSCIDPGVESISTTNGNSTLNEISKPKQNGGVGTQVYFDVSQPLPKLPLPDLHTTMDKYLTLLKTVIPPCQYAKTKRLVEEFCKESGEGPKLQEFLLSRQKNMDNWANDFWLDDMYLNIKLPLLINSNPAFVFDYMNFNSTDDQIRFAAKFVRGMLDFKRLADTRTLPIDRCSQRENGRPMCMEQHYRLLTSYRHPGVVKDKQATDNGGQNNSAFIVVACRSQFYRLDVLLEGRVASEDALVKQLTHAIVSAQLSSEPIPAVGLLTSQSREVWAKHRQRLMEDETNRASLSDLENCAFLVCMDDVIPHHDMTSRIHLVLHGMGSAKSTGNRWMDKTVQLVVSEDGTCGLIMEHSIAEGIALGHLIDHAFSTMSQDSQSNKENELDSFPQPRLLAWNITPQSLKDIRTASESVDKLVYDCDLSAITFQEFGKEFIKQQKMSPDAFIQLSLQLTYYKIHGQMTSTYESASVRRFRQGRVDVIRANSPAALSWIKAMLGKTDCTEENKLQLFRTAIDAQQTYTQETIQGQGIDLHIVGLREAAVQLEMSTPSVFSDPSYKELNNFKLSTSQVPSGRFNYWTGYGAVVPSGYGCCYNPQSNCIFFCVSSFFSCAETSSEMFTSTLESSLNQMAELCQQPTSDRID